ncbi:MAG: Cof-type HAD-IIB family hydrolase [bacterium]|nr:Cof-type HAD-IIB family hydrolase [bacterium]
MLTKYQNPKNQIHFHQDDLLAIRWLAFDLDRTLIGPDKQLHTETVLELRRACDMGYRILLATGRPPRSTKPFVQQIERKIPFVSYNGGYAEDADGQKLCDFRMDANTATRVLNALRMGNPGAILLEVNDEYHFDEWNEYVEKHLAKPNVYPTSIGRLDYVVRKGVNKFLAIGSPDRIHFTEQKLYQFVSDQEIVRPTLYKESTLDYIETMPRGISKKIGIEAILNRYGWSWQNSVCIGDAINDLTMLRSAKISVAVEDASENLFDFVHFICPSARNQGVRIWLKDFLDTLEELRESSK